MNETQRYRYKLSIAILNRDADAFTQGIQMVLYGGYYNSYIVSYNVPEHLMGERYILTKAKNIAKQIASRI